MGTYYDLPWMIMAKLGWKRGEQNKLEGLDVGLAGGINLIDTAEAYDSERYVAQAVKQYDREKLFIATKVTMTHLRKGPLFRALEGSLSRLNTDHVDLYQVHQPSPIVPIRETMGAMEELIEAGKTRGIGVSNFSLKQTVEANDSLKKYRLTSTQMSYSLLDRSVEKDILPYCREQGMVLIAYFPLGHGKLAGEKDKLAGLCSKYGKTPAQVALNWLVCQPDVFPIPRASNPLHVKENLGACGWRLTSEDLAELDGLFPGPSHRK
jgi:diketogulonate reductase-like aldo/keto reductase